MKRVLVIVNVLLFSLIPAVSLAQVVEKSYAQSADCTNDARMTLTASVPADGDYKIWVLMRKTNSTTTAGIAVQGGECRQITVPESEDWEWVSGNDGIIETLTAGSNDFIIGVGAGSAQFDKVLATDNTSCEPTGDGANCLENPLSISVRGIGDDEMGVNGSRAVEAVVTSKPSESATVTVEFYLNNTLINSDNTAPYCMSDQENECASYDLSTLSDDQHILRVVASSSDQRVEEERVFTKSSTAPAEPPADPNPTTSNPPDSQPQPTPPTAPVVPISAPNAPTDLPDLTISLDGLNDGETVSGAKTVTASVPQTSSATVTFTLSGRFVNRDSEAPYCMENGTNGCTSWDTNSVPNGDYELVVRATANGYDSASLTRKVKISNTAPVVARANPTRTAQNIVIGTPNQQVSGPVRLSVPATQVKPGSNITYKVDDNEVARTTSANPSAVINTSELSNGQKTVSATIQSPNGSKSTVAGNVTVRNDTVTATSNWFRDNMLLFIGIMAIIAVGTFFGVRWLINWYKMRQLAGDHNLADSYQFVMPEEQVATKQYAAAGMAVFAVFALGAFGININRTQAAIGSGFVREAEESIGNFVRETGDNDMVFATLSAVTPVAPAPPASPVPPTPPNPPAEPQNPNPAPPSSPTVNEFAFVGNYSDGERSGFEIVSFRKDGTSGALSRVSALNAQNHAYFRHHPTLPIIYAVSERYSDSFVEAFRYDRQSGALTSTGRVTGLDRLSTQISINPNGTHLIVANYSGGTWQLVSINSDGTLGGIVDTYRVTHPATTPGSGRQDASHPHGTTFHPAGRFAVAQDLGTDTVDVFEIVNNRIVSVDTITLPPGTGPRQSSFSADGRYVYILGELNASVTAFSFDAGTGQIGTQIDRETIYDGGNWAAEILTHPSGDFVFATHRSNTVLAPNVVTSYRVDESNGTLNRVGSYPTNGLQPRTMGIDPSGSWLYTMNVWGNSITQFRVNTSSGILEQVGSPLSGVTAPAGIVFSRP